MMTLWKTAPRGVSGWLPALVVFFGVGCARSGVEIQRMPDGSNDITCPGTPLAKCLDNVETVCKGASYEVLYARDEQKTYGVEQTYVEKHTSRAQVHCLGLHEQPRYDGVALAAPSASAGAPAAPGASAAAPGDVSVAVAGGAAATHGAGTSPHACVPGATQACVGVAACAGGQACLPDGSGYGSCDCGAPASGAPSR